MFPVSTLRTTYAHPSDAPPSPLLPLAGGLAGLIGLGAYWLGTILFPPPYLPVLLSMATVAGLTLARPESGLATYVGVTGDNQRSSHHASASGTVWLVLLLLARLFVLQALFANEAFGPVVALKYVMAHSLSHLMAASVRWSLPDAASESDVAARPVATPSVLARALATGAGLLPMLVLVGLTTLWIYALFLLPLLLLRQGLMARFRRDGGYTGAGLGAVQQLSELLVYVSFVSLLWVSI